MRRREALAEGIEDERGHRADGGAVFSLAKRIVRDLLLSLGARVAQAGYSFCGHRRMSRTVRTLTPILRMTSRKAACCLLARLRLRGRSKRDERGWRPPIIREAPSGCMRREAERDAYKCQIRPRKPSTAFEA